MDFNTNIVSTPPTIVVIFGASGDLTARKLARLYLIYQWIHSCHLIAISSVMAERRYLMTNLENIFALQLKHSRRKITEKVWNSLKDNLSFHAGSYDNIEDFNSLNSTRIDAMEKALNQGVQCLFYISTPPSVFKAILENLGTSGLAKRHRNTQIESKVIIEKPFGRDLKVQMN